MSVLEEIQAAVEAGRPRYVENLIRQALEEGVPAKQILEEAMVPAMRSAGEYYRSNESDIPRILAAARSMRKGLDILEPCLKNQTSHHLGKVILGTVEGDLHDVGKNLVAIMFRSAGFQVIDLGVDVSREKFVKAVEKNPDISLVCCSALLTTTLQSLRDTVAGLNRASFRKNIKIMVGGAPVTQALADEIGADAYTKDAAECARRARELVGSL